MDEEPKPPLTGIIDNPFAPETFVAGASGFLVLNGNIVITLEAVRSDYSTKPPRLNRMIVQRIVMPVGGAQMLATDLNNFLEANGLSPSKAIVGDATKQ